MQLFMHKHHVEQTGVVTLFSGIDKIASALSMQFMSCQIIHQVAPLSNESQEPDGCW